MGYERQAGTLTFGQKEESTFLGRPFGSKRYVSEAIAWQIDSEIKRLLTENYERTQRVLNERMVALKALASALVDKEVLDAAEVDNIILQSSPMACA